MNAGRGVGLLGATMVALWFGVGSASANDDIAKGRALAERLCARCHMVAGQGEKRAANEIPGFAAVARRRNQTSEGIVAWLRSIPPMMPNHHLSQDEMYALAAFIMTLGEGAKR
ncbi:MAG: cytochrome c [Hyphomicrobium sp.]|nr:cytochrome c [Hyphomicrobium sp.]